MIFDLGEKSVHADEKECIESRLRQELEAAQRTIRTLEGQAAGLRRALQQSNEDRARFKDLATEYRVDRAEANNGAAHMYLDVAKAVETLCAAMSSITPATRAHVEALSADHSRDEATPSASQDLQPDEEGLSAEGP